MVLDSHHGEIETISSFDSSIIFTYHVISFFYFHASQFFIFFSIQYCWCLGDCSEIIYVNCTHPVLIWL